MNNFTALGLSPLLVKAISEIDLLTPTEIQKKAIPILIKNKIDFIGQAQTGTGKTAAFGLALLNFIDSSATSVQALVLTPTRELSNQTAEKLQTYSKYLPEIKIECISGGAPIKPQIKAMKQATHIVVATPGRLLDLLHQKAIDLSQVKHIVLDEADEMLSLGFKEGLDEIISHTHKAHSTWLFSATMPNEVKQIIAQYMKAPVSEVRLSTDKQSEVKIHHQYVLIDPIEKFEVLAHFLNENEDARGIIFCRTKASVQKLHKQLAINRFSSGALHGDLPQGLRDRVMDQFKAESIRILVASDVAARGIDVDDLSYVIHYHLPDVAEVYTHRSGRTARAGKSGISLSFVFKEEMEKLHEIENALGIKIKSINRPESASIDSNKAYLWAKRILKTKMEKNPDVGIRNKIGEVFKHLSKEELLDRLVADQMATKNSYIDPRSLGQEKRLKKKSSQKNSIDSKGRNKYKR